MSILKKLNPDLLKDSILEIRFQTELPFDIFMGTVYNQILELGFGYKAPQKAPPNTFNIQIEHVFENDIIRLAIQPGRLIFNKAKDYPLWEPYFLEITKVVEAVNTDTLLISRVGLRYINEFQETNIFEHIRSKLNINFDNYQTHSTNLKTEIIDPEFKIILNLGNGFIDKNRSISLLDIDVISEIATEDTSTEKILSTIDRSHTKEKEIFVDLLNEEYLNSLDPEFE